MPPVLKFASDVTVKDGTITAILSTESVDRDGDIVRLDGWDLANFTRAPRLMSCHDYGSLTKQIGEWRGVHVDRERKALVGEAHYYVNQGNPEADWAYFLATQGQATYSVGFAPIESEPRKGAYGSVFTRQELLECSHVPIPAQPEALQLMAKALAWQKRYGEPSRQGRQAGRPVHKWDSNFMGDDDEGYGWGAPIDIHCIVPGCDDACQLSVPVCASHLKGLLNLEPEPPEDLLEEQLEDGLVTMRNRARHLLKAGKVLSAANLDKLHGAMTALDAVHSGACDGENCPLTKGVKAGSAIVHPFEGTHTHSHTTDGSQGGDVTHEHPHVHQNDGVHAHEHKQVEDAEHKATWSAAEINNLPDSAFAVISAGGEKDSEGKTTPRSLRHLPHHKADGSIDLPHLKDYKNALSRLPRSDLSEADKAKAAAHLDKHAKDEGIGDYADEGKSAPQFGASLEDAMTKALEAVNW